MKATKKNKIESLMIAGLMIAIAMTQVACSVESSGPKNLLPPIEAPPEGQNDDQNKLNLGEETLVLDQNFTVNHTVGNGHEIVYKDFLFESERDQMLYFSSVISQMSDQCENNGGKIELIWTEMDEDGNSLGIDVTNATSFRAKANTTYILSVYFLNVRDCGYVSISAAVSGF